MRRPKATTRKKSTGRRVSGVKHKTTHRRRRRVSGMGDIGGMVEQAGGIVLGTIAGREMATLLGNMIPSLMANPLMVGLAQVAGGMYLIKSGKGSFMANLGMGLVANGGVTAVVSTGIISGTGDRMAYQINGTSNLPVLNGTSNLPVVNGATRIRNNTPAGIAGATRISNNNQPVYLKPGRFSAMV